LAEAGYAQGGKYTITVSGTPESVRQAELLQAQLAKVGITVEVATVSPADSYALVVQRKINWTTTNWAPRADPHGLLYILFHSKGFANTTGYSNPKVDQLLEEAMTTYDVEKRKKIYREAQQIIVDDAPYIFYHHPSEWAAMSPKVQNFVWIPDLILRTRDLWLQR